MYRATYPGGEFESQLPSDYSGTAFREPETVFEEARERAAEEVPASASPSGLSSLFGIRLPQLKDFKLSNIGLEEILLLGVALILFFSKDGDKECAVMLVLLLFISG